MTAERNREGAVVVSEFVVKDGQPFLHTERFYGYSKGSAIRMFNESIRENGWEVWDG